MQRTLMVLGGSRPVVPVIKAAHALGCRVVTCDYLPDNVAHRYSDDYRNVSVIDKEAVLEVARELRPDGITSFAADPGAISAAYVAEQLGLHFPASYDATITLQDKGRFREFLASNGFNSPVARTVSSVGEAVSLGGSLSFPLIVKPVDSTGSKGVVRIDSVGEVATSVASSLEHSRSSTCVIEEYIDTEVRQFGGEMFVASGEVASLILMDQVFDERHPNPYVPCGHLIPSAVGADVEAATRDALGRLVELLGLRDGIFNFELRLKPDGRVFIIEVTPRAAGNSLSEFLHVATGLDLVRASVETSLGEAPAELGDPTDYGYWLQHLLVGPRRGVLKSVEIDPEFEREHVRQQITWVSPGGEVEPFESGRSPFGALRLRFDSRDALEQFLADPDAVVQVVLE